MLNVRTLIKQLKVIFFMNSIRLHVALMYYVHLYVNNVLTFWIFKPIEKTK